MFKRGSQTNKKGPSCLVCLHVSSRKPSAKCPRCGITDFTAESFGAFNYEELYGEGTDYVSMEPRSILAHYRASPNITWALEAIRRRFGGAKPTVLEFGASQGAFIRLCQDEGIQAVGFELNSSAVEYGRNYFELGNSLINGPWVGSSDGDALVDVVCAFETLEHLRNPLVKIQEAASWLRPGGVLILSVPNEGRLKVRLRRREIEDYPPHHLTRWTAKSMRIALKRAGLTPERIEFSAVTRSEILGALCPNLSQKRAFALNSFRPVSSPKSSSGGEPRREFGWLYSVAAFFGLLVAKAINIIPGLGSRLLVEAVKP